MIEANLIVGFQFGFGSGMIFGIGFALLMVYLAKGKKVFE